MARRKPQIPEQSEESFLAQVIQLARLRGWLCFHCRDSRRSRAGFPDLCMVRCRIGVRGRVVFAELKAQRGRLSGAQRDWIGTLQAAGAEAYVWRPESWEEIERVLE